VFPVRKPKRFLLAEAPAFLGFPTSSRADPCKPARVSVDRFSKTVWLVKGNRPMPYPLKFRPVSGELSGLVPLLMCLLIRRCRTWQRRDSPSRHLVSGYCLSLLLFG
jgi:hypothetical protein